MVPTKRKPTIRVTVSSPVFRTAVADPDDSLRRLKSYLEQSRLTQ